MEIEYDPAKDAANIAKHQRSLAEAAEFPMAEAQVYVDDRYDYGETRWRAFARVGGEGRCLVFTMRDGMVRVISYRAAHDKEMRRYGK